MNNIHVNSSRLNEALAKLSSRINILTELTQSPEGDEVVKITYQGKTITRRIQPVPDLSQSFIRYLARSPENSRRDILFFVNKLSDQLADLMRQYRLQYLDAQGNIHIEDRAIALSISGAKHKQSKADTTTHAFTTAGVKLLFIVLSKPETLLFPYRDLAELANIGIGTVSRSFNELSKRGHLIELPSGKKKLIHKQKLLEQWLNAFELRLRPKTLLGRFTFADQTVEKKISLDETDNALFGGEQGASLLVGHLKPGFTTIYLKGPQREFIIKHRLRSDPDGRIELRKIFWGELGAGEPPQNYIAPPLLLYADLLATGDIRNKETADLVFTRYIRELLSDE